MIRIGARLPVILVHGGAWAIPESLWLDSRRGVQDAVAAGFELLDRDFSALDAVEAAVRVLEDNPAFDAGRGSVFNEDGDIEMDAMIMSGDLRVGSVAGVRSIRNPIRWANI